MGIVGGNLFRNQTVVGLVLSILALCIVAVEQFRSVYVTYQCVSQKLDMTSVVPFIEKSQKIAEVLDYKGLLIMFKKVTLSASEESLWLSNKLAEEMNPDLIKKPKTRIVLRAWEQIK